MMRKGEYPISHQEHCLRTLEDEVRRLEEDNKQLRYALTLIASERTDPVKIARSALAGQADV